MKRRVTYRPNKLAGAFSGLVSILFVIVGVTMCIPTFGLFGVIWTLIAAGIGIVNVLQSFGSGDYGPDIEIEDVAPLSGEPQIPQGEKPPAEERFRQLRELYDAQLISKEEYEQKRAEILRDI